MEWLGIKKATDAVQTMIEVKRIQLTRHLRSDSPWSRQSCHDIYMDNQPATYDADLLLKTLAEFRYQLRRFLLFSESAALEAGLQPQQHQLLLQVAGAPENISVTISYAAERLALKHNSTVELVDRSEREGLLERRPDVDDKRRAILRVTRKGKQVLGRLAGDHAKELNELAPRLTKALKHISSIRTDQTTLMP